MIAMETRRTIKSALRPFVENGLISMEAWNELQEKMADGTEKSKRPELMTKEDVSKVLKMTTRSVNNLMREGVLPYVKPTGKRAVRFHWEDVERLIERNKETKKERRAIEAE